MLNIPGVPLLPWTSTLGILVYREAGNEYYSTGVHLMHVDTPVVNNSSALFFTITYARSIIPLVEVSFHAFQSEYRRIRERGWEYAEEYSADNIPSIAVMAYLSILDDYTHIEETRLVSPCVRNESSFWNNVYIPCKRKDDKAESMQLLRNIFMQRIRIFSPFLVQYDLHQYSEEFRNLLWMYSSCDTTTDSREH